MTKLFLRPAAFLLSTIGFFFGFTSKVLAQYGAPEMHFRILGKVQSAECEQPIGGVEVTLVNDVTGQVSKAFTDKDGNFNFRISEYYWEYKYTMNLSDIDRNLNQGTFLSKTVQFTLHSQTNGVHLGYNYQQNENTAMQIELDYDGENPCLPQQNHEPNPEPVDSAIREEEIKDSLQSETNIPKPEPSLNVTLLSDFRVFPNPNSGKFTVSFYLQQPREVVIQVYTLTGQLIERIIVAAETGTQQYPVSLHNIPAQTVIVRVAAGNEIFDAKIIVGDYNSFSE